MTFGQTIDTVVEQAYIEIDIAANLVDEMVTTDSEAVAIARHLPNIELRMASFDARSNSTTTTVDSVETVGVEVVWHTAGTTDTRDDYCLVSRDTHLRHGLLECKANSMVTTTRTELDGLGTLETIGV